MEWMHLGGENSSLIKKRVNDLSGPTNDIKLFITFKFCVNFS